MAILITPAGKERTVAPADPKRGFTLTELYSLVECTTVQAISLADGRLMWMDEEGKFRTVLAINTKATVLLSLAGGMLGDFVVGKVLITSRDEVN